MSAAREVVMVTGASRGIGLAVARRLLGAGSRVAAVARDASRLEALAGELGDDFVPFAADLERSASATATTEVRAALVARITDEVGLPAGFVAAAGIAEYAAGVDVPAEAMRRHYELHVVATLELVQALAARWISADVPGSVVAISSTLATRPAPFTLAYGASKAALDAMVRSLALELAPRGIRVNAVAPGVVDTEMVRAVRPDGRDPEARLRELAARHPVGRLATPDEIARTILQLLDTPFMTGSIVVVDGGLSLG